MERGVIDWATTLSVVLGAFFALAAVVTLVGMPWRYATGGVALAVVQVGGSLLTVAFGVGLGWFALRTRPAR